MKFIWAKGLSDEKNVTLAFVWKCNEEQRKLHFHFVQKTHIRFIRTVK